MSLMSAPYWWVQCDATGCDNRCPGPEYEHTAWAELSGAVASAEESGWRRDPAGKWFCDEHPRCEDCSEPIDDPALAWVEGVAYHRACNDSNATLFRRQCEYCDEPYVMHSPAEWRACQDELRTSRP